MGDVVFPDELKIKTIFIILNLAPLTLSISLYGKQILPFRYVFDQELLLQVLQIKNNLI